MQAMFLMKEQAPLEIQEMSPLNDVLYSCPSHYDHCQSLENSFSFWVQINF